MKSIILNEDFGQYFEASEDFDDDENMTTTFTFYPKKKEFEHYHITPTHDKLVELYELLKGILETDE